MASSHLIRLFGPPCVLDPSGKPVPNLGPGKPLALLAYLLVEGPTSREKLVGLLWGDVAEGKARNAFRQALHRLRNALGEEALPHDPEILRVAEDAGFTTDITAFEAALQRGEIDRALDQYHGDFLAGLEVGEPAFEEWAATKRARLRARYRDALRLAVQTSLESGDAAQALQRASQLAAAAPDDADAILLYASTLLAAGRRGEALHALDEFSERYTRDFGKPPQAAVRDFSSRLRRAPVETASQPGSGRARNPFVGRERELSALLAQWRLTQDGAGSLVFLEGEAGIGKTRIIEEFFSRTRDLGSPLLLLGRERSAGSAVPYSSIAEALRGALNAPGLAGTSQHLLVEAARLLPQLRDQFPLPEASDVTDGAGRLRFFEGVAAVLDAVAYEQPVCLALDDFHNSSAANSELAFYLAERLQAASILFLLSARQTPAYGALKRARLDGGGGRPAAGHSSAVTLEVGPLDIAASFAFAREFLAGRVPDEMTDQVVEVSGGLPYRIAESAERALAGDSLQQMPVRLKDVLGARLQRCTQPQQRLFVAAALIDRPASIRLLAAASHLPESSALDAALALEKEGLLLQLPEGIVPAHDSASELALEGTGPAGRALLAGWAADALERDGGGSDTELAALFTAAGRREESSRYSRKAAFAAASLGAIEEAVRHLETAFATASNERERQEITRTLAGLRGGPRRISGEVAALPDAEPPASAAAPAPTTRSGEAAEEVLEPGSPAASTEWPVEEPPRSRAGRRMLMLAAAAAAAFLVVRGASKSRSSFAPGTALTDTLLVAHEISPRNSQFGYATGPIGSPVNPLLGATRYGRSATWLDSLRLPWMNAKPSPNGRYAAVERMSASGSNVFVITADRRDTIPIATGAGDDISAGWSPDSRWLLVTHGVTKSDGSYDADLVAYSILERGRRISVDTSGGRAVVGATWSPDGTHIAWTARVGSSHQQEIFVADADGQNLRNISSDSREDYSPAWSPDGKRLAFTSERTGSAELHSVEIGSGARRRLTWDAAHADRAAYSPDGRWIAYESTRGGTAGVYVMPSWGGTGRSISAGRERITIVGWSGPPPPYLDRLTAEATEMRGPGDRQLVSVKGVDQHGRPIQVGELRFRVLDRSLARVEQLSASVNSQPGSAATLIALSDGLVRVEASAASWRADTAYVSIGAQTLSLLGDDFERPLDRSRWIELGSPRPVTAKGLGASGSGLIAKSDRQWQSGILSNRVVPVRTGLEVKAWVKAPFAGPAVAGSSFTVGLVAADPAGVPDSIAPEFLRLAGISWRSEAGRMSYNVDREIFTEPVAELSGGESHTLNFGVADDGTVEFFVDGARRWRSTLRIQLTGDNSRAQLWLGSQAAGSSIIIDNVSVTLKPARPRPR